MAELIIAFVAELQHNGCGFILTLAVLGKQVTPMYSICWQGFSVM